jgi:Zn-dependent protease with chaperone function
VSAAVGDGEAGPDPGLVADAEAGDVDAMYWVASWFSDVGDKVEALRWWTQAAELGDGDSMVELGWQLARDGDREAGRAWLMGAYELEARNAAYTLGVMAEQDDDRVAAEEWFRRGADRDEGLAMYRLGRLAERDGRFDEAVTWLRSGVAAGSSHGQTTLAYLELQRGSLREAEDAYRALAEAGDADSMEMLAWILDTRGDDAGAASMRAAAIAAGKSPDGTTARLDRRQRKAWGIARYAPLVVLGILAGVVAALPSVLAVGFVVAGPIVTWLAVARYVGWAKSRNRGRVRFAAWPHAGHVIRPYPALVFVACIGTLVGPVWAVGVLVCLALLGLFNPFLRQASEPAVLSPELAALAAGPPPVTVLAAPDEIGRMLGSSGAALARRRVLVTENRLAVGGLALERTVSHEVAHARRGVGAPSIVAGIGLVAATAVGYAAAIMLGLVGRAGVLDTVSFAHAFTALAFLSVAAYAVVEPLVLAFSRREERETERLAIRLLPPTADRIRALSYTRVTREPAVYHLLSSRHPARDQYLKLYAAYRAELDEVASAASAAT